MSTVNFFRAGQGDVEFQIGSGTKSEGEHENHVGCGSAHAGHLWKSAG